MPWCPHLRGPATCWLHFFGIGSAIRVMNRLEKKWATEQDPAQQRRIMVAHGWRGKVGLARNPHLDPEILMDLLDMAVDSPPCSVEEIFLRETLAQNPTCPEQWADTLLVTLAAEDASNEETPGESLDYLSRSGSITVRRNVARNKECPPETLVGLSGDIDAGVRGNVAQNNNSPSEALFCVLDMMDDNDGNVELVLNSLAHHRNATSDLLDMVMLFGGEEAERLAKHNPRNRYVKAMLDVVAERAYEHYLFALSCGADPMTAAAAAVRVQGGSTHD